MITLYPWLEITGQRLAEQFATQRLPHAMLLAGGPGVGADRLVDWLEAMLLCQPSEGQPTPCGHCRSCRLLLAGNHADVLRLAPEGKSEQIRVDAVRQLVQFSQGTPQLSAVQVVVIEEAHRLNIAAANALLKVLEEPPQGTYLILQTSSPAALLPTIRSRVQWVRCPLPKRESALKWLQTQADETGANITSAEAELALNLAGGEPCRALQMATPEFLAARAQWLNALRRQIEQPSADLQALTELAQAEPMPILSTWSHWLADLVRLGQTNDKVWVQHTDQLAPMEQLASAHDMKLWLVLYDAVMELQGQVRQANNLNWQLLLESFWLKIPREVRKRANASGH